MLLKRRKGGWWARESALELSTGDLVPVTCSGVMGRVTRVLHGMAIVHLRRPVKSSVLKSCGWSRHRFGRATVTMHCEPGMESSVIEWSMTRKLLTTHEGLAVHAKFIRALTHDHAPGTVQAEFLVLGPALSHAGA